MTKQATPLDDAIETAELWLDMWADEMANEQSEMDEEGEGNEVDQEERNAMRALGMVVIEVQRQALLIDELSIYKRAMDSMAAQMIHPKMTGLEMAEMQLKPVK